MSIGLLNAKLVLDHPEKIHYGSNDPVTGNVVLRYGPSAKTAAETNAELFGPLFIALTFHGRAKTKIVRRSNDSKRIFRGRAPLFQQRVVIYDDSFRCSPGIARHFPFTLYFPDSAPATVQGDWDLMDSRFEHEGGGPLPPSYRYNSRNVESFVEYRLGVDVRMPRLQLEILKPSEENEPFIRYERARPSQPIPQNTYQFLSTMSVSNEQLLPEADRPSGFRQKAKAAFSSDYYPTYAFNATCTVPQHLTIGSGFTCELRIKPIEKNCTAILIPDVKLSSCHIEFKRQQIVRAEQGVFSSHQANSEDVVKGPVMPRFVDKAPFSKANDWTKTLIFQPINGLPCAFKTFNIAIAYTMKIKFALTVAGKIEEFKRSALAITLHPPALEASAEAAPSSSSAPIAGSSRQRLDMNEVDQALPAYEEVPNYDEAVAADPPTVEGGGKSRVIDQSLR